MRRATYMKAQQIARMFCQGCKPAEVAKQLGMSCDGLLRIRNTREYLEIEESVQRGVLAKMDAVLEKRTDVRLVRDEMADDIEDAMPEAVEVLLQNLRQKHDLKAALEVLDRDPQRQFAKGSRSGQSTNVGVGVQVRIDSQALAQAIDEANKTHEMIERATKSKPALTRQRF